MGVEQICPMVVGGGGAAQFHSLLVILPCSYSVTFSDSHDQDWTNTNGDSERDLLNKTQLSTEKKDILMRHFKRYQSF